MTSLSSSDTFPGTKIRNLLMPSSPHFFEPLIPQITWFLSTKIECSLHPAKKWVQKIIKEKSTKIWSWRKKAGTTHDYMNFKGLEIHRKQHIRVQGLKFTCKDGLAFSLSLFFTIFWSPRFKIQMRDWFKIINCITLIFLLVRECVLSR